MPKLSVILSVHNQSKQLPELLDMQFKQTRPADELIIIDDLSTDDSYEVAKKLTANAKNVRLYRNRKNLGVVETHNRGFELATGTHIFNPTDNCIEPQFYEKSLAALERHPQAALSFGDPSLLINNKFKYVPLPIDKEYLDKNDFIKLFRRRHFVSNAGNTVIVRKELFKGFNPLMRWHTDFFILNVLALRHGACYIPGKLAAYRVVDTAYSRLKGGQLQRRGIYQEMFRVLKTEEFRDVRPICREARLLAPFGIPVLAAILTRPQNLDFLSLQLLNHTLRATCIKPVESLVKKMIN